MNFLIFHLLLLLLLLLHCTLESSFYDCRQDMFDTFIVTKRPADTWTFRTIFVIINQKKSSYTCPALKHQRSVSFFWLRLSFCISTTKTRTDMNTHLFQLWVCVCVCFWKFRKYIFIRAISWTRNLKKKNKKAVSSAGLNFEFPPSLGKNLEIFKK